MFIRKKTVKKDGKSHDYWALVESYRTGKGPRQQTIAWLGEVDTNGQSGLKLDSGQSRQHELFAGHSPKWVEVDIKKVHTERSRDFGDLWLCFELMKRLGFDEVFDGNRQDVTTVEEVVTTIEELYDTADRIGVMDRGMISKDNISFLKEGNRRFIIGTPKSTLKKFEKKLLEDDWTTIHEGLEVKSCVSPDGDDETYILCRSSQRKEKEKAIFERFVLAIEKGLEQLKSTCERGRLKDSKLAERRIGRLLERNKKAAALFDISVGEEQNGLLKVTWAKKEPQRTWAELWQAYIHLTDAEAAFRIQKHDLQLRPIWHQKEERVQAHILVCFLAYVLWKFLGQLCKKAGIGDEPRKIIHELRRIKLTDVVLPTKCGRKIKIHCVTKPDKHQQILLHHLKLKIPPRWEKNRKM